MNRYIYRQMPVSIHSCFWKNESLNLKLTQHAVFSDDKYQLSVHSSVCLQEFKQCLSGQLQRKIIVMAKVSLQARAELFLLRAIICLSASFSTPSCFKIE